MGAGILDVEGSLTGTSSVVVNSGATLAGGGTVDPVTVTINSGATFAPGTPGAPGTSMTIAGNLAFQSGAFYVAQLNSTTSTFANVTGTASLAGTVIAVLKFHTPHKGNIQFFNRPGSAARPFRALSPPTRI